MPTDSNFRFALGAEMDTRPEAQAPLLPLTAESTLNKLVFLSHSVLNHSTTANLQRLASKAADSAELRAVDFYGVECGSEKGYLNRIMSGSCVRHSCAAGYVKKTDGDGGFVCEKRTDDMWAPKNNMGLILGLVFGILALLVIAGVLLWLWRSGRLRKCNCCSGSGKRPDFRRNNFSVSKGSQNMRPIAEFREVQSPPRVSQSPVSLAGARASHQRSRSVGASTRVPSVFWDDYGDSGAGSRAQSRRVLDGDRAGASTKVIL